MTPRRKQFLLGQIVVCQAFSATCLSVVAVYDAYSGDALSAGLFILLVTWMAMNLPGDIAAYRKARQEAQ